jgi:hypothetical protein
MRSLTKYLILLAIILATGSCKNKKKTAENGDRPIEISDFKGFFPSLKLPYLLIDSTLKKKSKDSTVISYDVFTQFVPDSIIGRVFGKKPKLLIYPIGRVTVNGEGDYLFAKATTGTKHGAFLLYFDKNDKFITGMTLLRTDQQTFTSQSVQMDRKYTIIRNSFLKNKDGSMSEGKDVYAFNAETGTFTLIMTDDLGDHLTELINPIDTFPRKNKYSADYTTGKMNLVSIRDGRKNDRLRFFIHFQKENEQCSGELKGEAIIRSATMAEYREGGDPCVLQFQFSSAAVTVLEVEGCGAHRDLRCSFNGRFPKKKEVKPKTVKKKAKRN